MDVLARLRSDMDDAGREAHKQGENETDACLDILEEFIAEYEVLRTVHYPEGSRSRCYYAEDDGPEEEGVEHVSILVLRERKPGLLKAAEALHVAAGKVATLRAGDIGTEMGAWEELRDADAALAEAIAKEKSDA